MTKLKRISADSVVVALEKAAHYRLLNEPMLAESICLDVLEIDSQNQRALVTLLLSLTDQFPTRLHDAHQDAESLVPKLLDDYDKHYYQGIIWERWASNQMERGTASTSVPEWLSKAMNCFELAQELAKSDNPDPILRWNTCVRIKNRLVATGATPTLTRDIHGEFGDDVPLQ